MTTKRAYKLLGFDSSEVLVAAGAASGTIKLWDLEEAKNPIASWWTSTPLTSSLHLALSIVDTNFKIWDIRKKGCIHNYKGHTRGVNAIRFTPDGRWVVSGGEDSIVKDHEGQIQCLDFHPHEFLLVMGSSDRTVKFWDLETFKLIGSAGPETTGVRCLTFNPDGRTVLCGLHESLKGEVFSWEPIRCHDGVDVEWSKLSDFNVHEGKLLGCSCDQSCVGVWVVDISCIEPYAVGNGNRVNGRSEAKSSSGGDLSVLNEITTKATMGRFSVSQNPDPLVKEQIPWKRVNLNTAPKTTHPSSVTASTVAAPKRSSVRASSAVNFPVFNKSDVIPVNVPRNDTRLERAAGSRKEVGMSGRSLKHAAESRREARISVRSLEQAAESRREVGIAGRS
ncbi:hypothetical protein CCACVL1_06383 [Corchorus capsularis]|uniref:Anaphase-promoting complex subunit 4 WD40 domain-containing protein n=1 Tax=Corchorus capsularis TaxID=210143 RepID=A0A1R3JFX3_COCAP|nr:hypothetical protein CCACVL1_06383 [Corchorus capsularis]